MRLCRIGSIPVGGSCCSSGSCGVFMPFSILVVGFSVPVP